MNGIFSRVLRGWLSVARGAGFLLLLVAGSAVLAAAIALPLWSAALARPGAYSIAVIAIVAAAAAALVVRSAVRARRAPRDPSRPPRTAGSVLFAALKGVLLAGGLYGVLFLSFRGIWLLAGPAIAVWLLLAGWAAFGSAAGKAR